VLLPVSFADRLGEVLKRTLGKVGPDVQAQLAALIDPTTLEIMAGVLAAWVVSHAFGLGEIIDVILVVGGWVAVGWSVLDGIDHLYEFAKGTYDGQTPADFDAAAEHLAQAIAILGVQAVLAILFRGAKKPLTGEGGRLGVGPAPRNTPWRYTPGITQDATQAAGAGLTDWWGDVKVSTRGSLTDRRLAEVHERVHQFLAPKFYFLREYRASNRAMSYVRSSLYRYIEEAIAETVARVGVEGFRKFFVGVRFPVRSGYVYLLRGGGYKAAFKGAGVLREAGALLYTGIVCGVQVEVRFRATVPQHRSPATAGQHRRR
jgi:hypothetical protein